METKKRHLLDDYLSEAEKSQLENFCSNPLMVEAVRKVMLFPVYSNGVLRKGEPSNPLMNFMLAPALQEYPGKPPLSDVELGQETKARAHAIRLIEIAFAEIEGYKQGELPTAGGENPAR